MPTISEGRLAFKFPNTWKVCKFDDTNFYRKKMPNDISLASVDFVTSPPGSTKLILIEVKDFRGYARENRKRQSSGELVNEIIKKTVDTFSGLYLAAYTHENEVTHFYVGGLLPPGEVQLILFMEEDALDGLSKLQLENHKKRLADMTMKLDRMKFNLKVKSKILNTSLLGRGDGFSVASI